jgi:fibronectin-binding autotransporter adhesin
MKRTIRGDAQASFFRLTCRLIVLLALVLITMSSVRGQTSTWNTSAGTWGSGANWNNGVAGTTSSASDGDTAIFSSAGAGIVTVDSGRNLQNVTFNGSSAYTLSGGSLVFSGGGTIQSTATAIEKVNTPITLEGAYTFDSSSASTSNALSFASTATLSQASSGTLTLTGSNTGANTISGVMSDGGGTLSVAKSGAGTWILSGANSYSGGTTISAGTLEANNNSALGASSGTITLAGGTLSGGSSTVTLKNNILVQGGATSYLQTSGANFTLSGSLSGTGTLTMASETGSAAVAYLSGNNSSFSGTFMTVVPSSTGTSNGNSIIRFNNANTGSANASWIFNNTSTGYGGETTLSFTTGTIQFGSFSGSGEIQSNTSGTATIQAGALGKNDLWAGQINNGTGTLAYIKTGTGTQTFTGANGYTGTTTINQGTLQLGNGGTTGTLATGSVIVNNGNFAINRSNAVAQGTDFTSSAISGSGSLTQMGSGTTTLGTANTYTGSTTVSAGVLRAGINNAFGNNSAVVMANALGATLDLNNFNVQVGSLTGGGTTGGNVTLGMGILTVGGDNTSPAAYAGSISGGGGVTKIGTGNQTFTAANTYTEEQLSRRELPARQRVGFTSTGARWVQVRERAVVQFRLVVTRRWEVRALFVQPSTVQAWSLRQEVL